ncbi:MAG: class I SAM-dependent methyltransferase [Terracidiphilus sp.]
MEQTIKVQRPANDVQIWDKWNSTYRQGRLDEPSKVRLRTIDAAMSELKIQDAKIMEVGCGTGWLSAKLSDYGHVTACDIGKEIIETAQKNYPQVKFHSGAIESIELPTNYFDVVVTSEVLAHVPDQTAFIERLGLLLKSGGFLLLTAQNKYVFERTANISPPDGWIRKWVTMKTLKGLLRERFSIWRATTLEPEGHLGLLRVVNSSRVNHYLNAALGAERVKRLKERAGFGQSLFVIAVKR